MTVVPEGEPIFSELATRIEIADEADGEFVTITQSGLVDFGKIAISPHEWPRMRAAINKMIAECKKWESK